MYPIGRLTSRSLAVSSARLPTNRSLTCRCARVGDLSWEGDAKILPGASYLPPSYLPPSYPPPSYLAASSLFGRPPSLTPLTHR